MKKLCMTSLALVLSGTVAMADEFSPALEEYLNTNIVSWASDPVIIAALREANSQTSDYSADQINSMDQAWRAEVGTSNTPTIARVLNNPASDFLRQQVEAAQGTISEVFIMDAVGLNVAASSVTSDMWQGDEEKFTATYNVGADATHVADVEFDESTQTYLGQVSMTIADPDTGAPIGAITVGVNAEALF